MKSGDLVRWDPVTAVKFKTKICLLIEYHKWDKVGTILCDGKLIRVRGETLQKAGKRDVER